MPRACRPPVKRFGVPRHERGFSPERSVRTAESLSRSPSPPSKRSRYSKPKTHSPNQEVPDELYIYENRLLKSQFFRRRCSEEFLDDPTDESLERDERRWERKRRRLDEDRLDCPDELYNLTKLAEVASVAGQLFSQHFYSSECEDWPEQEYPEDLSRESSEREEHPCPECGKRYSTSSNLARHRQTHRSLADKKARRCPHCDKVYVSMPAFAMHVRTHSQGCRCSFCGKCFSRPWLLQGHIRTHTGEKPFKCTTCSKAFADKSNLRAHIQTHSTMKPYVCARCGKAFALKSYLYKHEESSCMKTMPDESKIKSNESEN